MRVERSGFGRGKVILLGEHAVVHGVPAIAAGLGRGATSMARRADEDLLRIAPWGRALRPNPEGFEPLSRAFASVLASYPQRPHFRVEVTVELAPGAGLGCSAAVGVSVIDAIDKALGIERRRDELGARALAWERFFHGAPSGVDNATASLGGLVRFERGVGASTLATPVPIHFVVAHSGQRSSTRDMVERVARQLDQQPRQTRKRFDDVRALVVEAEAAIERGDPKVLGRALDSNHEVLLALGLGTAAVEELRRTAKCAGALGAKVTGAGGGGCIVALAEDRRHAVSIATALGNGAFVEEVCDAA